MLLRPRIHTLATNADASRQVPLDSVLFIELNEKTVDLFNKLNKKHVKLFNKLNGSGVYDLKSAS